jgi:hypothetical protein
MFFSRWRLLSGPADLLVQSSVCGRPIARFNAACRSQSGEARICEPGLRLTLQQLPSLPEDRFVSGRLGRRSGQDPGSIRGVIDLSGRPRAQSLSLRRRGSRRLSSRAATFSHAILHTLRSPAMSAPGHQHRSGQARGGEDQYPQRSMRTHWHLFSRGPAWQGLKASRFTGGPVRAIAFGSLRPASPP